ncbi:MAG: PadR family transcriptional regulator [Comamonas sp.]|nr:PadR family transcriptional regulator [Comamonas sp.]
MSLPHALLTALIERPGSGLELAERFDRSLGHFWHATHQQIYRELARLEDAGWVASEPVPCGRGRKRSYAICDLGRTELLRWLAEPTQPAPLRDELMVRLRAAAAVGPSDLAAAIAQRVAMHEAKLALYRSFEHKDFASCTDTSREHRLKHLVLQAGIRQEQLWIELANEALAILQTPDVRAD